MKKTIFLDTNIFLHYKDFDQIDWLSILQVDSIIIIIPPVTVRELNKNKDSNSITRIRKRAGTIIKKLSKLFETDLQVQLHDSIEIKLEGRDPVIDFATYQLSRDVQDDHLIASILTYRNELPGVDIVLVTSDSGLILWAKAQTQNITTIRLSESLKLSEEPDPEQETIRQLKEELRKQQLRKPQLLLAFEDGEQHATFTLTRPIVMKQDEINKKINEIKASCPYMAPEPKDNDVSDLSETVSQLYARLAPAMSMALLGSTSEEDIVKYSKELDLFYQLYAKYLQDEADFHNLKLRTIQLTIWLTNDGTAPSEDIDVFMQFPDGFNLFEEGKFPKPPKPPEPPTPPKTQMQKMLEMPSIYANIPYLDTDRLYGPAPVHPPPNVSSPSIKRTSSYDVEIHVQRLKHQLREAFDSFYVVFDSYVIAQSFQVNYEILAADLPHKATGTLHIIIEKDVSEKSS
jgi:hypothetical protein